MVVAFWTLTGEEALPFPPSAGVRTRGDHKRESTLCENLQVRRSSISGPTSQGVPRRYRVSSAPPVSRQPPAATHSRTQLAAPLPPPPPPPTLQRRRSFSAVLRSYSTKGEMLRDIFTAFPAPELQASSRRQGRPSSAVTLRAGKIPNLRRPTAAQVWV